MDEQGKVSIYHHTNRKHIIIKSFSKWFNEEYYTIDDNGDSLIIRKCYLDIPGRAKKFGESKRLHVILEGIPKGDYFFDEDEDEDEIHINYKNKTQ